VARELRALTSVGAILPTIPRATALAEATEYGMALALCPKKNPEILQIFDRIAEAVESL
jgi:chromosome partitioning protein